MHAQRRYTLTAACPDRIGIVATVATFIADNQGWILETSHHADEDTQRYFMRIEMKADSLPALVHMVDWLDGGAQPRGFSSRNAFSTLSAPYLIASSGVFPRSRATM